MKIFLKKLIYNFIFIFIIVFSMEALLRNIPNDYEYKNRYLTENAEHIKTIFLGSSHTFYGINPKFYSEHSFNASHFSQSIDLDYKILEKYSDEFDKLEYIVLPIDYATLFNSLGEGAEDWRLKNYILYYDMDIDTKLKYHFEISAVKFGKNIRKIFNYYIRDKRSLTSDSLGFGVQKINKVDLVESGKLAAERHTIEDKSNYNESIKTLNQIISFAKNNDASLVFYTSPAFYAYRENLDRKQLNMTINTIDSISETHQNTSYFNLLDHEIFTAEDFLDADHLNDEGAKKLTILLKEKISELNN